MQKLLSTIYFAKAELLRNWTFLFLHEEGTPMQFGLSSLGFNVTEGQAKITFSSPFQALFGSQHRIPEGTFRRLASSRRTWK
jgi:hypothetical protein